MNGGCAAAMSPRSCGSARCSSTYVASYATCSPLIAAAPPAPLLFHCVAGKDRTGLIAALLLALADVTPQAIARDYSISSENLRDGYLQALRRQLIRERIVEALRCPEEGAHNMLKFLAEAGGVRVYLAQIGLSEEQIARLRARLRP